jgi:hypothetical protein
MNMICKFSWETLLWYLNTMISVEQTICSRIPTPAACMHRRSVPWLFCQSWAKQPLITYRAPCKQGGPRNFYIGTLRDLNAIGTSGALLPGVVWLGHEASTELTFKSLAYIHGVHRDYSSRPELAWNGWIRSEYFWDFLFRRAWSRACQKLCYLMFFLRRKYLSEVHAESAVQKSVIMMSFTACEHV